MDSYLIIVSPLKKLIQSILTEGGAYGHLSHLYESMDLTFGEILDILHSASEGKLENVTEKTDGINIFFTVIEGELRVATNSGFTKNGGMSREEIGARYESKPPVQQAYLSGYDALQEAIRGLSPKQLKYFFGDKNSIIWYSIEIMTTGLASSIQYGKNILSIHLNGSKIVKPDGSEEPNDHENASQLGTILSGISQSGDWEVQGPAMVKLPQMSMQAYERAASRIRSLGVNDSDTVQDFLALSAREMLALEGLKEPVLSLAAKKMAGFPGQPSLTTFKKQVPPSVYLIMQNTKEWAKQAILPLEDIITDFAVERLRGVESALVDNGAQEIQRLKELVEKSISAIEASGDENAMQILQREMVKLKSVDNIVTPMEGIVFHYKGRILKLTGAFSSFHKILSLFTFGKGGSKLSVESKKIHEGGHALPDMQPVPLELFKNEYPSLTQLLKDIGADKIVPIGSTGKKELMGDIDLAIETELSIEEFQQRLEDLIGKNNVTRNATVISFAHDFGGIKSQVDLMFGKTDYLSWSRAGTDPRKTPFKGVARNILLNILTKVLSERVFEKDNSEFVSKRYTVDLDKGLYVITRTKYGKSGKVTSNWNTKEKEFITDNPEEIVSILLGKNFTSKDTLTFEDLVSSIRTSPLVKDKADVIIQDFIQDIIYSNEKRTGILGPNTEQLILKLKKDYS